MRSITGRQAWRPAKSHSAQVATFKVASSDMCDAGGGRQALAQAADYAAVRLCHGHREQPFRPLAAASR